jgi:hypothetical protein
MGYWCSAIIIRRAPLTQTIYCEFNATLVIYTWIFTNELMNQNDIKESYRFNC